MPIVTSDAFIFGRIVIRAKTDSWIAESVAKLTRELLYLNPDPKIQAAFSDLIQEFIKEQGFMRTLKHIQRLVDVQRKLAAPGVYDVTGILKINDRGQVDAALKTPEGKLVLVENARQDTDDIQTISSPITTSDEVISTSSEQLILTLANSADAIPELICQVEFTQFDPTERESILPILWKYIDQNRNSQNRDVLVAVGSAIRKFIALIPMDRMGEISLLLAPANYEPLALDLELEVAKMIYRNFEVYPPTEADPQPELAARLLEVVNAYINPRILLRDKHSAVTSLAIEAIVSMRSKHARDAWQLAINCPHKWFGEMVSDDLLELEREWREQNDGAAEWLADLRTQVIGEPQGAEQA